MPVLTAEQFWQFSLHCYEKHQTTLLRLQDDNDLNVNMLLLCIYLQRAGVGLSVAQFNHLLAAITDTEQLLQSMRELRQQIKLLDIDTYQAQLKAELLLEKCQQRQLCTAVSSLTEQPVENEQPGNLVHYCIAAGQEPSVLEPLLASLND